MKILVAVKQVAALEEDFEIRGDGRGIDPDFLIRDLNEWDDFSLEQGFSAIERERPCSYALVGGLETEHQLRLLIGL